MRKIYTIAVALFITASVWAQTPQKMSYQAVVRNSTNQLVADQKVGMRITIVQGSATGTEVYSETQTPATNTNGLVSIEIGGGADFSSIDWSTSSYFIKTEIDPTGGNAYSITGTSQLLSVPYALYAKTSGSSIAGPKGDKGEQGIPGDSILTAPNGTKYKLQVANDGTISTVRATQTIPVVETTTISAITATTAIVGGTITSDGGAAITARGVCWSTTANPTVLNNKTIDGSAIGPFASSLTGLLASTVYYVRAYATNGKGTAYGTQTSVTTSIAGSINTVTDIDGNSYKTVIIGTQVWMAENLKVTKYNDGTEIPNVTDNAIWGRLATGAQCDYSNTPSYTATYGKLYNWYAVNTAKLCPTGWHVPSDAEWTILSTTLGGDVKADVALKEKGTTHWTTASYLGAVATNTSGFTALPGGERYTPGDFNNIGVRGYWWSSTANGSGLAYNRSIPDFGLNNDQNKQTGISVRCLRD